MFDEKIINYQDEPNEKVGIFVKRILAKYLAPETQILFQEKRDSANGSQLGLKESLRLYINNAGDNGEHPVQGISEVIFSLVDNPTNIIISNSKSRIRIIFKVFLLVKFQDMVSPGLLILPDDIGTKCMTQYDLTLAQHKKNDLIKESLQISDGNFMYTADIPLAEFDNQLTPSQFNDSTLQPHIVLKNYSWLVDVDDIVKNGSGNPPAFATSATIAVYQDILDKIGIDDDIFINGFFNVY